MLELSEQTEQRIGAAAAVIGPIAMFVFIILRPINSSDIIDSPTAALGDVADNLALWGTMHVGLLLALLVTLAGLDAVRSSFGTRLAETSSRLGLIAATVATALVSAALLISLGGIRWVAETWAGASAADQAGLVRIAQALDAIDTAFLGVVTILLFGLVPLLYGFAVTASDRYPQWLGWVGVVIGAAGVIGGAAVAGSLDAGGPGLLPGPLMLIWTAVMGVLLWLRSGEAPAVALAPEAAS